MGRLLVLRLALLLVLSTAAAAETGLASWYGNESGSRRADGRRFDASDASTCAHRTLPFGTRIRVAVLVTGRWVECYVLDRGPYRRGRVVDLARGTAERLGIIGAGVVRVRVTVVRR